MSQRLEPAYVVSFAYASGIKSASAAGTMLTKHRIMRLLSGAVLSAASIAIAPEATGDMILFLDNDMTVTAIGSDRIQVLSQSPNRLSISGSVQESDRRVG
jgi:hypothetical protein